MEHVIVRVDIAIECGKNWDEKLARWLVVKNVFPGDEESMLSGLRIKAASGM